MNPSRVAPIIAVMRGTTILAVNLGTSAAMGGDGQVTLEVGIVKRRAQKIRRLHDGRILVGFAGSTADSLALLERFESKLKDYQGNLLRSAVELAKDWRMDRKLRQLQSMLVAMNKEHTLLISGAGDLLTPDDGIIGVGSGGLYAVSAARALVRHTKLDARQVVEEALKIASEVCVYTNDQFLIEEL